MEILVWFILFCSSVHTCAKVVSISIEEQDLAIAEVNRTCQKQIEEEASSHNESYCERVWDTLSCWPPTPAGRMATIPCPNYFNSFDTAKFAHKFCTENGTWFYHPVLNLSWTDYTDCAHASTTTVISELYKKHMPYIRVMYNIGYGISLVSLVMATSVMSSFRRLRCPRNIIHINLFMSFILRAAISFLKENMLVHGLGFPSDVRQDGDNVEFIQEGTHWGCKLFFTSFHYILGTNYVWILVEGLYLNLLITMTVFNEKRGVKWFLIFGWTCPVLFVVPWVIVRILYDNTLCWNTNSAYFWIMRGPVVFSVLINFLIFLNIVRILFTKLTAFNSFESKKFRYRRLAKSTLVLIPLFGIHYIVFIGLPDNVNEKAELVKLYFEMFFNSIQGFVVALLFCFFNHEVRVELAKKWIKYKLSHGRGHRSSSSHRDTITSFLSRGRGSVISSSFLDGDHRRPSTIEMKHLRKNSLHHDMNENHKTNGHIPHQEENEPMLLDTSSRRPND